MSGKFTEGDDVVLKSCWGNRRGRIKQAPRIPPEGYDYFVRFVRAGQVWYSWCAERDLVPLAEVEVS